MLDLTTLPIAWLITITLILGLVIGSFLNVVIHRLPIMLRHAWQGDCAELNGTPPPTMQRYNLLLPGSACPHCHHPLAAYENIPILSYLWQRGRCRHCHQAIAWRYPVVELITAITSAVAAWWLGSGWPLIATLILTWGLITLAVIDIDTQLLPDTITQPLLWLGLLFALLGYGHVDLTSAVIGAIAGYLSLWSVYWLFRLLTGKEGMGYGDFKLLALLGAWLGWQQLPAIILLSALVATIVGLALILLRGRDRQLPIPFGPYLAIAGWIAMLWGDAIRHAYLSWAVTA
jgi:leader peptidase (prepilin peptidase) / N-methyltransferase